MRHQRRFDTSDVAQGEPARIRKVIADLERNAQLLDGDIAVEEERAGIYDRSAVAYPVLAQALAARRDNLRDTIAALKQRLSAHSLDRTEISEAA